MNRPNPEITLLIASFQRPDNLRRCLSSVALQQGVEGRFEVVVNDDGSRDDTARMVQLFATQAAFPLKFVTHPHQGYRVAACRNAGVRASRAPYLLFTDGDCILPPDHLRIHLEQRRHGAVNGSDCLHLDRETSEALDETAIRNGDYRRWATLGERWRVRREHWDSRLNWLLRHPHKPKLFGNNIALWRSDLEHINGFDERFRGWGGEDDDLRLRLRAAGLRIRSLRHLTRTWHLWHPPADSVPARYRDGPNVPRVQRPFRLTRCLQGLKQRRLGEMSIRVLNPESWPWHPTTLPSDQGGMPELEFLILPGKRQEFSGEAQCNVLVLTDAMPKPPLKHSHLLITHQPVAAFGPQLPLDPDSLDKLWELL